jgi:hypothetical protein
MVPVCKRFAQRDAGYCKFNYIQTYAVLLGLIMVNCVSNEGNIQGLIYEIYLYKKKKIIKQPS